jgi:hypothetical protein
VLALELASSCSRSNVGPESDRYGMGCYTIRAYRRGRTCPRADYEVWAKAGDHASSAAEGSGVTIGDARLAAGAVSGGGVDQAYDGLWVVPQFEFQQRVVSGYSLRSP